MELEQLPEVQKIINIGKANGEITYDEINDILPERLTNSDKIDDVFILLNQYGIDIIEEYNRKQVTKRKSAEKNPIHNEFAEKKVSDTLLKTLHDRGYIMEKIEGETLTIQDVALQFINKGHDLSVLNQILNDVVIQKSSTSKQKKGTTRDSMADDPVRLYLKEISRVSLISNSKEVELAKRIEAGEHIIEKSILQSSLLRNTFVKYYPTVKSSQMRITDICRASKTYYVSQEEKDKLKITFIENMEKVIKIDNNIQEIKIKLKRCSQTDKKYHTMLNDIDTLEKKCATYVIKIGVSQKELNRHVNKIKSMIFRIKEIQHHFCKIKREIWL